MVDSISALGTGRSQTTSANSLGGLDSDVFLQLMVAQLRYQNPMEPTDATAMMQQTAQFTTVETLQAISETQQQLMNMSQLSAGLDMVGKDIDAIGVDGSRMSGTVTGVRFSTDGVVLELEHGEVPLVNVIGVTQPPAPPADQGGGAA